MLITSPMRLCDGIIAALKKVHNKYSLDYYFISILFKEGLNCIKKGKHLRMRNPHNRETTINGNTKLVIVGTITPPDVPYFYCSKSNRIYGYLDNAFFGKTRFKQIKESINEETDDSQKDAILSKLKSELTKHRISFLDVFLKVAQKEGKQKSCRDSDFENTVLDHDAFTKISKDMVVIVIVDSLKKVML